MDMERIPFKRLAIILACIGVFALFVGTCANSLGSGSGDDDDDDAYVQEPVAQPTTASASSFTSGGESAPDADENRSAPGAGAQPTTVPSSAQGDFGQLVIRNAQVTLRVENVPEAVGWVRNVAIGKGGFVFSSSTYIQESDQFAQLTIRVPSERFDEAINELRTGALVKEVEREESSSQDVSAEFVDNESRLVALRETQSRFLALLEQAETVDDILRLEYEISNIRTQIEQIQGRQNYLQDATSLSTISVALYPVGATEPQSQSASEEGFSITEVFERAWEHSEGAIESSLVVLIVFSIFALILAPFAALAYVARKVWRARQATA